MLQSMTTHSEKDRCFQGYVHSKFLPVWTKVHLINIQLRIHQYGSHQHIHHGIITWVSTLLIQLLCTIDSSDSYMIFAPLHLVQQIRVDFSYGLSICICIANYCVMIISICMNDQLLKFLQAREPKHEMQKWESEGIRNLMLSWWSLSTNSIQRNAIDKSVSTRS